MNGPARIDPLRLAEFVSRPGQVVLFLSVHPSHRFNRALCEAFVDEQVPVAFGEMSLEALWRSPISTLAFLLSRVHASGDRGLLALPPGYYLFRNGQLLAWHLGLPVPSDAKRLVGPSILAAGLATLTRNLHLFATVLGTAAEEAVAARIAARFREAAAAPREEGRQAPCEAPADELLEAYRMLGVQASASDEELVRAWRTLQRKYHPDRAGRDANEFERLSRRCGEINRARDVIRKHRRSQAAGR